MSSPGGGIDTATRMLALAKYLFDGGVVTTRYVREQFKVSLATAKRDLARIEQCLPVYTEWYDYADVKAAPVPGRIPARHLQWRYMDAYPMNGRTGNSQVPYIKEKT